MLFEITTSQQCVNFALKPSLSLDVAVSAMVFKLGLIEVYIGTGSALPYKYSLIYCLVLFWGGKKLKYRFRTSIALLKPTVPSGCSVCSGCLLSGNNNINNNN